MILLTYCLKIHASLQTIALSLQSTILQAMECVAVIMTRDGATMSRTTEVSSRKATSSRARSISRNHCFCWAAVCRRSVIRFLQGFKSRFLANYICTNGMYSRRKQEGCICPQRLLALYPVRYAHRLSLLLSGDSRTNERNKINRHQGSF